MEFGLTQKTNDKINSVFKKQSEIDKVIIYKKPLTESR